MCVSFPLICLRLPVTALFSWSLARHMISAEKLQEMLGPGGIIARNHPNYEYRPGQIRMAAAVAEALAAGSHLCVEAGTGTGKTLAYLLPCLHSQKRVIISTGTKNLQEQLFFKDIPFLEKTLGSKFSVCYMKGRSNYLCLTKLANMEKEGYLFSRNGPDYLIAIRQWAKKTETGDFAEMTELPENMPLWHQLNARRETCSGQKCPEFESCFVTKVRQRALESDIVVVNHHLFFADLALRQGDFGSVLPEYSIVIFDEAHELEDVATQYFGITVSNYQVEELVRDTAMALSEASAPSQYLQEQLSRLTAAANEFFNRFLGREGRYPFVDLGAGLAMRRGPRSEDVCSDAYGMVVSQLALLAKGIANLSVQSDILDALMRRAAEIREALSMILESDLRDHVFWFETRGRGVFLWASPICVGPLLKERLFGIVDSAVLTSATLSTEGHFRFIRSRLGLEESKELLLGSHFDFSSQAVFFVPKDIPEPREEGWVRHACVYLEQILEASRGRAFLLFTSYSQMESVYQALQGRLPYPMFLQGQKSKAGLLQEFRETPNAVLFATSSFWQGVDVQGEQLSCVVIDKLPFAVPSDPVVAARIRQLNDSGGNAFYDYQIPEAIILLKQGLGRLIRSRSDRGILALLDKRVLTRRYGRLFLDSLPPAPLVHDSSRMRNFLKDSKSTSAGGIE